MRVADAIASILVEEAVTVAVGISGGTVRHLADALAARPEISLVYARQERVAVDIADGFARAAGRPAVVFTDSGPAAANTMGGLVNSWGDSTPVLLILGHNPAHEIAARGVKEIPFKALFGPVSKWVEVINFPNQVAAVLRRAFMKLRSGRRGPVVLALPVDVSEMDVGDFAYVPVADQPILRGGGDPSRIREAIELIRVSRKTYVYSGAGVLASGAAAELLKFAELLTLPVATTLNGKSGFPEDHPLSLGIGGFSEATYSSLPANVSASQADLIITIGCGFKQFATTRPVPETARHIQIEVDPDEIDKDYLSTISILGDAKVVLSQLIECARASLPASRLLPQEGVTTRLRGLKAAWKDVFTPYLDSEDVPINPFRVTSEINGLTDPARTIVVHDAGSVRGSVCQHYVATRPNAFLGFGVQSCMGWAVGAAIGAKKAEPGKLVIAVTGEEALLETATDIETSVNFSAPILIVVKNNGSDFDLSKAGTNPKLIQARFRSSVDICRLASALGAKSFKVIDPASLRSTLAAAIEAVSGGTTALVEIVTARVATSLSELSLEQGRSPAVTHGDQYS